MVSAIERAIDQSRHPGIKRTRVRSPDRFQITNMPESVLERLFGGTGVQLL